MPLTVVFMVLHKLMVHGGLA